MSTLDEDQLSEQQTRDLALMRDPGSLWDDAHWKAFYRLYFRRLVRRAERAYHGRIPGYDAQDLVQEALIRLARSESFIRFNPSKGPASEPVYSFAWLVVWRSANGHLRALRRRNRQAEMPAGSIDPDAFDGLAEKVSFSDFAANCFPGYDEQIRFLYDLLALSGMKEELDDLDSRREGLDGGERNRCTRLEWKLIAPLFFFAFNWQGIPVRERLSEHRVYRDFVESIKFSRWARRDARKRRMMIELAATRSEFWSEEFRKGNCGRGEVIQCMSRIIKLGYLADETDQLVTCRGDLSARRAQACLRSALTLFETRKTE